MALSFEWDRRKARHNLRKHRVSFAEAVTAFADPLSVTIADPVHSGDEERYILVGAASSLRLLVVVHTERGDRIRIISARTATQLEQEQYEQQEG
ncbi:MAG TPA: BrnT family toxin [Thermoanaerobaculia bacterium]|nr:BrnT family toxin [Thermoanaerobaculia bacterium]